MLHGGLDVKLSETRGMSQRGGSVSSHIRIGETVVAPSISPARSTTCSRSRRPKACAPPVRRAGRVAIVNTQQIVRRSPRKAT